MDRLIFHIDVNSAYLSWTAVKLLSEGKEDIRLIPSAVGGDKEKRTGIILAKSIPAKKFGVTTGEPVTAALRKCPKLVLVQPDFSLYEKNSKAFMDICREYTPIVEKFSIDECFLDMTGTQTLYPNPVQIANMIKDRIHSQLGFTVNVGIGPNKLLAKMASDFEKPDKVHTLFFFEMKTKMWPLPVGELFSVGHKTAEKLQKEYIHTIGELAHTDLERVQYIFGKKAGKQIWEYANGIDDSPVLSEPEKAKGYSISTTLEQDITSIEEANKVLLSLSESVTRRMRADQAKASCVSVTIRGNDFKDHSHQKKLFTATDITSEVYSLSKDLLLELWKKRIPLRLIGISLTGIVYGEEKQLSLFSDKQKEKARKLDRALDGIRNKFGSKMVVRGSIMDEKIDVGKKYQAQLENKKNGK